MIFIQENAAFIQVLIYQDWHNQLISSTRIKQIHVTVITVTFFWYICTHADFTFSKTSCIYRQNFNETRKKFTKILHFHENTFELRFHSDCEGECLCGICSFVHAPKVLVASFFG